MNIAYIYRSFSSKGGIQRITIDKANALAAQPGINVHLVSLNDGEDSGTAYKVHPAVKIHRLNLKYQIDCDLKRKPLSFIIKLLKWNFKIHRALRHIVRAHDIDITVNFPEFAHHPFTVRGCRNIYESHNPRHCGEYNRTSPILRYPMRWLNFHRSSMIVTLTKADAKEWPEFKRVEVIPNFTDIRPVRPSYNPDIRCIVAVGRICDQKGFDILVEAWRLVDRKHPDWKLDIYGDDKGEELRHAMLQSRVNETDMCEKISFRGTSDNMADVYGEHSMFVLSSRYEGFGLVLLEAMACGLPCVSFDCPYGPAEIISDGRDGLLVPFDGMTDRQRAEALAGGICRMIEDRDMRTRMSAEAVKKASGFSRDTIIARWVRLFNEIMEK